MQFDKDMNGEFAELFLEIRDLILANKSVSENSMRNRQAIM
jgi:hypothetical protein